MRRSSEGGGKVRVVSESLITEILLALWRRAEFYMVPFNMVAIYMVAISSHQPSPEAEWRVGGGNL